MTLGSIYKDKNKYEYILSGDELYKSFAEARAEAYALRKEVKRNRYIHNAEGMQNDIENIVYKAIISACSDIEQMICNDVAETIEDSLNGIIQSGSGVVTIGGGKQKSRSMKLAEMMGREIVKGIAKIIEENMKNV